ncbi:MAG TPA: hypothetical protein VHX61_08570 [Rhizomicrobium sp.]|jgi:hypothetical protein|nr:hypothetical protein [Rhizomicrobium sp.]
MLSSDMPGPAADSRPAVRQLLRLSAHAEAAFEAFRETLPDYGLKLVMPPPDGAGPRAFASVWLRGQAQAISHRAPTPSRAVLRAVEVEYVKRRQDDVLLRCDHCRGLDWFITPAGTVEMCHLHD